jgi:predicted porin
MTKLHFAALAIAAAAVAAPAQAQSSVTVFGVVDLSLRSVKNNATQSQLGSSGLTSSRIGFRGTEDLGGGMKAHFWIEGALDPDTGNPNGQTWQRRSTIGLQGGFGEIRMGREKNADGLTWEQLDPFADTGMAAVGRLQRNYTAAISSYPRSSNMVSYYTPGMGGFFGALHAAAGEGADGNKHIGGRLGYSAGPIFAVFSYGNTEAAGNIDVKRYTFGATYDLKFAKFHGMYANTDAGAQDQKNWLLGVTVPMGQTVLRASYQRLDHSGVANQNRDARALNLGAHYNLSRRTAVYAIYADIANSGNSALTVATGSPLSAGRDSTGYEFGIRHSF